jgi:hypothetical protein
LKMCKHSTSPHVMFYGRSTCARQRRRSSVSWTRPTGGPFAENHDTIVSC